jgi:hypothetical protein
MTAKFQRDLVTRMGEAPKPISKSFKWGGRESISGFKLPKETEFHRRCNEISSESGKASLKNKIESRQKFMAAVME